MGSTSYITDASGEVYQHLEYFAFGETFVEEHSNTHRTPYLFNGKELDEETGLYYYGARYYSGRESIWLSVDPLAEKYSYQSGYVYCGNNPINKIDPEGMDEWEVNQKGETTKRIENKEHDSFHMVDENGNRIDGKSISFKHGTVERQRNQSTKFKAQSGKNVVTQIDIYQVRGDDNATQLFEFFADNTSVEWSQTKTGKAGDQGLNFLTTSHWENSEAGAKDLLNGQLQYGYSIREQIHSHPGNTAKPSGLTNSTRGGDVGFANAIESWYSKKYPERNLPIFKIYTPKNGNYVPYSGSSTYCDFNSCLPEIIIKGN